MTYSEFVRWCKFREQYGPLHVGMRVDRAIARHIAAYLNSVSRNQKFKAEEFSPYDQQRQSVDLNDPQAVFAVLKGLSKDGITRDTDA